MIVTLRFDFFFLPNRWNVKFLKVLIYLVAKDITDISCIFQWDNTAYLNINITHLELAPYSKYNSLYILS